MGWACKDGNRKSVTIEMALSDTGAIFRFPIQTLGPGVNDWDNVASVKDRQVYLQTFPKNLKIITAVDVEEYAKKRLIAIQEGFRGMLRGEMVQWLPALRGLAQKPPVPPFYVHEGETIWGGYSYFDEEPTPEKTTIMKAVMEYCFQETGAFPRIRLWLIALISKRHLKRRMWRSELRRLWTLRMVGSRLRIPLLCFSKKASRVMSRKPSTKVPTRMMSHSTRTCPRANWRRHCGRREWQFRKRELRCCMAWQELELLSKQSKSGGLRGHLRSLRVRVRERHRLEHHALDQHRAVVRHRGSLTRQSLLSGLRENAVLLLTFETFS